MPPRRARGRPLLKLTPDRGGLATLREEADHVPGLTLQPQDLPSQRCEVQQPAVVATVENPLAVRHILAAQRVVWPRGPGPSGDAAAMAT